MTHRRAAAGVDGGGARQRCERSGSPEQAKREGRESPTARGWAGEVALLYGLYDVLRVQLRFNEVTCILHTCRECANCAVRVVVLVPPNRGSPPAHAALSTAQGGGGGEPLAHVHRRPPSPEGGQWETVHAEGGPQRSPDIGVSARMGPATVCAPSLRTSWASNPNRDASGTARAGRE